MLYEHIRELPSEALALADSEVESLAATITAYKKFLSTEQWSDFRVRVAREWAIETGQIEGLYQFERGITTMLLEQGISASRIPESNSSVFTFPVVAAVGCDCSLHSVDRQSLAHSLTLVASLTAIYTHAENALTTIFR